MIFGYARVSTDKQNLERQIDALNKYGIDKLFTEKMTGTKKDRPELNRLLDQLREVDTVVIESLSRLGRSTKNLVILMEELNDKGVNLVSLKENIDTTTATGKFMFSLMSALSQMERDLTVERVKEGLEAAKARGRKGGRPSALNDDMKTALELYENSSLSVKGICEKTGVKRRTLYDYIKKQEITRKK